LLWQQFPNVPPWELGRAGITTEMVRLNRKAKVTDKISTIQQMVSRQNQDQQNLELGVNLDVQKWGQQKIGLELGLELVLAFGLYL